MAAAERKVTILFIQASPPDQSQLDTGTEMSRLEDALWSGLNPAVFDVRTRAAVRSQDIEPALRRHRPQVVHFSGHGNQWGDLLLNAPFNAESYPLSAEEFAEKLRRYMESAQPVVRLVVLAGCYTDRAAKLVSKFVDCAIGMDDRVDDPAMVEVFTPTLYRALGDGYDVAAAVAEARQELRNHPDGYGREAEAVKLYVRPGVDARALKLTELAPAKPEISQAHAKYLQALFKQRWARVKMKLFDPRAAQDVDLLEIYSPLPVDFAISLELDKQGGVKDWWCTGCRSEREGRAEPEPWEGVLVEPGDRRTLAEAVQGHKARPRAWTDLRADERALQPLLKIARSQVRKQKSEGREFPVFLRERDTFRWQAEAEHAALVQRRFVLVGDPGSGKSTFLRHLALSWAAHLLREAGQTRTLTDARLDVETGWPGPNFTPVYIELRPLVETFPSLPPGEDPPELPGLETFESYLANQLAAMKCETFYDDLIAMLADGRGAILLDGLDEVSDADDRRRRRQVQAFVAALQKAFDRAPIIVTARPYAYRPDNPADPERWELPGFGYTVLVPLEPDRQVAMARRLFACLPSGDAGRADAFVAALREVPRDLPGNPLLLTLLAAISFRRPPDEPHALPRTRGELYDRALTLLVKDWVKEHDERLKSEPEFIRKLGGLNPDDLRLALQLVARRAQERSTQPNQPTIIQRTDFYAALDDIGKGEATPSVVKHLHWAAGMLLDLVERTPGAMASPEPGRFRFLHLSFQEYLAACDMLYRPGTSHARPRPKSGRLLWDERSFPDALVEQVLQKPRLWANVLRLAVDELLAKGRAHEGWELLARCCRPYLKSGHADLSAILALQIALDAGFFRTLPPWEVEPYYKAIRDAALKALEDCPRDNHRGLSPEQRDIAGRLLGDGPRDDDGRLLWPPPGHDPRPGVGLRRNGLPDIAWVKIEGPDVPGTSEVPGTSSQTFWIAKYPVTYAQYRAFLEAPDGFRNPQWWRGLGAPREHRERPGEQQFQYWNHPAENVSWYDAMGFCYWLTAKMKAEVEAKAEGWETLLPKGLLGSPDWKITLPTEWQWEKAARGRNGWRYPWGPEYRRGYANVNERWGEHGPYYLQKTSAVGMYPQGASPDEVQDMSGNVWEWCLSGFKEPEGRFQEQTVGILVSQSVVRGGSWYNIAGHAAISWRSGDFAHFRYGDVGFRVVAVRSSP